MNNGNKIETIMDKYNHKQLGSMKGFLKDDFYDVIEQAISREMETAKLYRNLSERMISKSAKKALLRLAEEEDDHAKILESFLYFKPEDFKVSENMGEVLADHPDVKELGEFPSIAEVLLYAINHEQEGHEFYRHLAQISDEPEIRDTFVKLSRIELAHRNRLEAIYERNFKFQ